MSIDQGLVGRELPPTAPYDVSRSAIASFAAAIGADDPVHHDVGAARTAGYDDVVAPLTYPIVVAFAAMNVLLADPEVAVELHNVVHAEQRFEVVRPVRAGDVLTARLRVESLRSTARETFLPVIVLTADANEETKRRALRSGATDFLLKPFDEVEVLLRISNMLEIRRLHLQLAAHRAALEDAVRDRTSELREAQSALEQVHW